MLHWVTWIIYAGEMPPGIVLLPEWVVFPPGIRITGHLLQMALTIPYPGLLAGGPNPGEQDHCHYDFHEPETAYSDSDCAYASNEIAINWNAPLVYLANALEALLENNF